MTLKHCKIEALIARMDGIVSKDGGEEVDILSLIEYGGGLLIFRLNGVVPVAR